MTYEEALKELKRQVKCWKNGTSFAYNLQPLEVAVSALEKQIPQKVNISLNGTTDWNTKCRCPVCRKDLFDGQKYCSHCGQLIDWGDT